MKTRLAFLLAGTPAVIGLAFWQFGLVESASASPEATVAAVSATVLPTADDAEYVGAKKCKMCHLKQHKSWGESKKASAMESLEPGKDTEIKTKFGLDPEKDYTKDESCLACHTTGYGKKGGYALVDASDEKAVKAMKDLANVGCESCHGPGSAYLDHHKDIMKEKRKYKVDEMYAAGLWKIEESMCVTCHNEKSPTYDKDNPFDFEKMKDQSAHEHFPLGQREE
jgi:hypothetical protein